MVLHAARSVIRRCKRSRLVARARRVRIAEGGNCGEVERPAKECRANSGSTSLSISRALAARFVSVITSLCLAVLLEEVRGAINLEDQEFLEGRDFLISRDGAALRAKVQEVRQGSGGIRSMRVVQVICECLEIIKTVEWIMSVC